MFRRQQHSHFSLTWNYYSASLTAPEKEVWKKDRLTMDTCGGECCLSRDWESANLTEWWERDWWWWWWWWCEEEVECWWCSGEAGDDADDDSEDVPLVMPPVELGFMCRWVIIAWSLSRSLFNWRSSWLTTCIWTLAWAVLRSSNWCSKFKCLKMNGIYY